MCRFNKETKVNNFKDNLLMDEDNTSSSNCSLKSQYESSWKHKLMKQIEPHLALSPRVK